MGVVGLEDVLRRLLHPPGAAGAHFPGKAGRFDARGARNGGSASARSWPRASRRTLTVFGPGREVHRGPGDVPDHGPGHPLAGAELAGVCRLTMVRRGDRMGGSGMKQGIYTITENRPLTADVWEMRLSGDTSPLTAPGQFINIKLEASSSAGPFSVLRLGRGGTDHHLQGGGPRHRRHGGHGPGAGAGRTRSRVGAGQTLDRVLVPPHVRPGQGPCWRRERPLWPSWASTPGLRSSTRSGSRPWGWRPAVTPPWTEAAG